MLFVGPPEGEIPRLLAAEQCGAAVAPSEGARLAGILGEWQADPAACARCGRKAREAFEKHFRFAHALARWEEILRPVAPAR